MDTYLDQFIQFHKLDKNLKKKKKKKKKKIKKKKKKKKNLKAP